MHNNRAKKLIQNSVSAVDLFCGAGGLTKGLENIGISVRLGVDIDPSCEFPYASNNNAKFLLKSVKEVQSSEVIEAFAGEPLRLLAGCAPCQTFSSYNRKANSEDKRWWLLQQFSRLVREVRPELVTMENVPGLRFQNVFSEFVDDLEKQGYKVDSKVVNCADYGLPQSRRRLVLLASKLGPIKLISPEAFGSKKKNVSDAIRGLPALNAGSADKKDPMHVCSSLSHINYQRILASKPGGTWRDWPEKLVLECHRRKSGKSYPSVYGRMKWTEPSPTITTQFYGFGNGRFGHPEQNRAISLREGAILQGFPKNYRFARTGDRLCKTILGRLIGNAVPVKLGEVIGMSFIKHIKEHYGG